MDKTHTSNSMNKDVVTRIFNLDGSKVVMIGVKSEDLKPDLDLKRRYLHPKKFFEILETERLQRALRELDQDLEACSRCLEAQKDLGHVLDCAKCTYQFQSIGMIVMPYDLKNGKYLAFLPQSQ